jgi:hypothetical protein
MVAHAASVLRMTCRTGVDPCVLQHVDTVDAERLASTVLNQHRP